jgi:hypothetical protein
MDIQASHDESKEIVQVSYLTDDNGKCFHQIRVLMVPKLQKNLRKIPMTKPGFEHRIIEMKVGRSIHFTITIRAPMIFQTLLPCSREHSVVHCLFE